MVSNDENIKTEIQKKEEQCEYNQLNNVFSHVLSRTFWDNAKTDTEQFNDIFANRKKEIEDFKIVAKPLLGESILLLGRKGVGKSSLIYKLNELIRMKKLLPDETIDIQALLLDLESESTKDVLVLIRKATKLFVEYIDRIEPGRFREFNTIEDLQPTSAVHLVADKLTILLKERNDKMPYIFFFIDDMDYALDIWFDLICLLTPITALPFISPVYAARPFLESKMYSCDDSRMQRILNDAKKINIATLPVKELLIQRLVESARTSKKKWWLSIITKLGIKQDRLSKLLENVALKKNGEFKYPFVKKFEKYIEKTTNGNSREMLHMLKTCLEYIITNRKDFKPYDDSFYHFERLLIMELFKNYKQSPIVNLNDSNFHSYQKGSPKKSGYPLLFNVLEWIAKCEGNDHKIKAAFMELGHTIDDIQKGLNECLAVHLIEPISESRTSVDNKLSIHNYNLTPKGQFHLTHIVTWSEYQKEFGRFKGGISREFYKKLPLNAMYTDIIEFLLYITTAIKVNNKASELDISLTELIDEYVKYQATYLRGNIQELYSPGNPNSDYMIDEDKLDYLLKNPPIKLELGKSPVVKGKYEVHETKRPNKWQRKLSIGDIEITAKKLKIGEHSTLQVKDRCDFQYFLVLAQKYNKKNIT